MISLPEFLEPYMGVPIRWGVDDCSLLLADWWRANHGVDPASHLRGKYSSEAEKSTLVMDAGGLLRLVGQIAENVSARPVHPAHDGEFAVILTSSRQMLCGIKIGKFWACRSQYGIAFTSAARAIRGWCL